ncbi:TetR/AcrR family transcriptional regulator [Rhodococcus sp. BP-349]|uniref:TetR/AcrR family transcriptional regulator n=1 Tax=unclassified Rhodococcus (in: high G+C Gram-positive bacteria) TaxID=192944 RepID=UPI001C9BA8D5|nr:MULTISPECIES: TetR family transcriptional regulator [unclassified Rhodococcus (in: high G+C Gram-positive bacteria)]MBY6540460.1 TetR/AcrR family transcriptional regulator [Rhodococcus sp. BP-363]MBY6545515.1 TetR/AcrR family transcriptional regulator [Rhodococcus sp. BP-369]MBY6564745.1 TetR/AcrR family transcriptional regulator [Rhodococcus sp. BP-370]MBY6578319.1 TetR/AcrR family transcriptional regulator [Rhodococcus sp. BP-364]MBY6587620.1 TetR/AcrR family transcriptional regulator [Rh
MTGGSPRPRRLLDAAADLFGARGYAAVGIDDVAAAAGVTGPSVYRWFDSKYDLLRTLHLTTVDRLERRIARESAPADLHTLALGALTVRRSLGTLRRDRVHLREPDIGSVAMVLDAVTAAARRTAPTPLPPGDSGVTTRAVLSALSSIGTHRLAAPTAAVLEVLDSACTAVLAVDLPDIVDGPELPHGVPPVGRRDALLRSAATLFDENEPTEVTMAAIASSVGLAASSTYRWFGGKTVVLDQVCLGAARRTADETVRVLARSTTPHQALAGLARRRVALVTHSPALRVLRRHGLSTGPATALELTVMARQERAEWVNLLASTMPGRTRAQAGVLVEAVFTVVDDLSQHVDERRLAAVITAMLGVDDSGPRSPHR